MHMRHGRKLEGATRESEGQRDRPGRSDEISARRVREAVGTHCQKGGRLVARATACMGVHLSSVRPGGVCGVPAFRVVHLSSVRPGPGAQG
jgi:hypothetical protein